VAVLYPWHQDFESGTGYRTGAHPGKHFSAAGTVAYRSGLFFQSELRTWSTIGELHDVVCDLAVEGAAFPVRSAPAHDGSYMRRTKVRKGKCPPGLKHVPLRWLPVDADKLPNVMGLDPRRDPVGTLRWIASLLGPEFRGVTCSAHFSSSSCVGVPEGQAPTHLSARLHFLLDAPLMELGCRAVLKLLCARVRAFFRDGHGIEFAPRVKPIDPKIADIQQPIYCARPTFDGVADPHEVTGRAFLLEGTADVVSLEDLRSAVRDAQPEPEAVREGERPSERRQRRQRERAARTSRQTKVPGSVLPLAASLKLITAYRERLDAAIKGVGREHYLATCYNLFSRRSALEMVALALHRGGLHEGTRDEFSTMIASAVVASMPLSRDVTDEMVRAEVRPLLVLVCGAEWVRVEWEEAGADASILARYRRAVAGERDRHGRDPRYTYSKARLLREWEPTYAEILALGLRSLANDADRAAAEREADRMATGAPSRDEWLAAARALAPRAHALRADGLSCRKVADRLGVSLGKALRLLALSPETVAQLAETQESTVTEEEQQTVPVAATVAEPATEPTNVVAFRAPVRPGIPDFLRVRVPSSGKQLLHRTA
jgi:hypothetical protein